MCVFERKCVCLREIEKGRGNVCECVRERKKTE